MTLPRICENFSDIRQQQDLAQLVFDKHVLAVTRSCNFHAQAIHHIRHLPIVDRSGTHTGLQSDPDETGLLQLGTLRRASQQHAEVAACAANAARIVLQA